MLSAVAAFALASATQPHIHEVWSLSLPKSTPVEFIGHELYIGGQPFDAATGFRASSPPYDFDVSVADTVLPDFVSALGAEQRLFANDRIDIRAIGKRLENGSTSFRGFRARRPGVSGFSDALGLPSQPIGFRPPFRLLGKLKQNYFLVVSSFVNPESDWPYHSLVVLRPFQVSPLKFVWYWDISRPSRALGSFHPSVYEAYENSDARDLVGTLVSCGDVSTGKIHWQLDRTFRVAGRIGNAIVAYNATASGWYLVDEDSGHPTRLVSSALSGVTDKSALSFVDGYLVVVTSDSNRRQVRCFSS